MDLSQTLHNKAHMLRFQHRGDKHTVVVERVQLSGHIRLCDEPPSKDGMELVRRLVARIDQNRSNLTDAGRFARGKEMWRWRKNTNLNPANKSIEVRIERAIVRLLGDDWVNQVPTASGLTAASEGRRSLDLVHRHSAVEFDFIELKALRPEQRSSGHQSPLFAAMEILIYGLIFLYCKENRGDLFADSTTQRPILDAEIVHLEVLATSNCYRRTERAEPFRIGWLNQLIVQGLTELNRHSEASVSFNFTFRQFPEGFSWTEADHHQLLTCDPSSECLTALRHKIQAAIENRECVMLV
jgi:hypothetical protein